MYSIILSCRNEYIYCFPLYDKFINDVTFLSVIFLLIYLQKYTSLSIYFVFCMRTDHIVILNVLSYHSRFWFDTNDCFVFSSDYVKGTFFYFLALEQRQKKWDSDFSHGVSPLNFFETCSARYHRNMIFTPREMFKSVVINTLSNINTKSTHPSDSMHFMYLRFPSTVTRLVVTLRQGGFSPLFPAATSTVGFCPSKFLIIRCYQNSINIT